MPLSQLKVVMFSNEMPKRVLRKRPYKKRVAKRARKPKSGFNSVLRIPRGLNMVVPPKMVAKFYTTAKFYIPAGSASVGSFDVNACSLQQPWAQTAAYDTAPRSASLSTPASNANGFEGLANWLSGNSGAKFYQNYRVHAVKFNVKIASTSLADTGECCLVPVKQWGAAGADVANTTLATATMAPFNKRGFFNTARKANMSTYIPIAKLFGVPKIAVSIDPAFSAAGTGTPTNFVLLRCLYGRGDGAVLASPLEFDARLTVYVELFNTPIGGQPETIV